jgi:DNA gyrase/topoisomerase IV subunit A
LIDPNKIQAWVKEVEERPSSGPIIVGFMARRLSDLSLRYEELLAENILLRSGQKIEEFQKRIRNLEYQLDILKRLYNAEAAQPVEDTASLMIFNSHGQVLRLELNLTVIETPRRIARLPADGPAPRLLFTQTQEELLFLFDSGRTARLPAAAIPAAGGELLNWDGALIQEPSVGEELAAVLPIGRLALADFCIQASRRGYVKRIPSSYFDGYLAANFVGSGVVQKADKTCSLTLCDKLDRFVMASREGALFSIEAARLSFNIEEALRLRPSDTNLAAFSAGDKPSLLLVTQTGKAVHREIGWLEPASSLKTHGQAILSAERRAKGVRLAGAAAVDEGDWAAAAAGDGSLILYRVSDLFKSGVLLEEQEGVEILSFSTFSPIQKDAPEAGG